MSTRGASVAPVAITGTGALCGAGTGVDALLEALLAGRSGVARIQGWNAEAWPVRVAAELSGARPRDLVDDRKLIKSVQRTDLLGIHAAERAIEEAGWASPGDVDEDERWSAEEERAGVFAGGDGGSFATNHDFLPGLVEARGDLEAFGRELTSSVSPMWLLRSLPNNVLCHLGIRHRLRGENACVTNEGVGGAQAIAEAARAIRDGRADRAVAVGHAASLDAETLLRYHHVGLLAADALRPFDRRRDGTVLGEGAAAVTLESPEHADARGARTLGALLGTGTATEATGPLPVRPDGEGLVRAIEQALAASGLEPRAVGMVVAHGNGTRDSDASEGVALERVFGGRVPPVTSFKWCTGHLLAAAGALDLVLALATLRRGVVPAMATLEEPDPVFDALPLARERGVPESPVALVLCRGFGGMNVAQLLRAEATA